MVFFISKSRNKNTSEETPCSEELPKRATVLYKLYKTGSCMVNFSQIYNQKKTEVIRIETASRELGGMVVCHPAILKLFSFMNEMNTLQF